MKINKMILFLLLLSVFAAGGCSINKMAVKAVSNTFTEGGEEVFLQDNDPELVMDSIPFILKLNEIMMEKDPENYRLKISSGKLFIVYSNLFIHIPADMLDYKEWKKQVFMRDRARKMYIRGVRYIKEGMEIKTSGRYEYNQPDKYDDLLKTMTFEDADMLFWYGAGIVSAVSIDVTDPYLASIRNYGIKAIFKAYELDPDYSDGSIHDFFILYYGSLPAGMGGSDEKAEYHYKKAVELSSGKKISPYISYASAMAVKNQTPQGVEEFKKILETALKFDEDSYPETRLENTIFKRKAAWMLENIDNFFLVD